MLQSPRHPVRRQDSRHSTKKKGTFERPPSMPNTDQALERAVKSTLVQLAPGFYRIMTFPVQPSKKAVANS